MRVLHFWGSFYDLLCCIGSNGRGNLPAPLHQSSADIPLPLWRQKHSTSPRRYTSPRHPLWRQHHQSHARTWWRFPLVRALLVWAHVDNHGPRLLYGLNDLGAPPGILTRKMLRTPADSGGIHKRCQPRPSGSINATPSAGAVSPGVGAMRFGG